MNAKFVKTTLVAGLALAAVEANAQSVVIGCAANANNTTGATVYSIDAQASTGTAVSTLSGYVALGAACSTAVNAMLQTYSLVGANNQTIQGAGYSLQVFTFDDNDGITGLNSIASKSAAATSALVGCAAPGNSTSGATVYSVDAKNSIAANLSTTLNARLGATCSNALSVGPTASGISTNAITGTTYKVIPINVTIANAGYSLEQFLIAQ